MRRLTRSVAYIRIRLVTGLLFAGFGVAILVQSLPRAGLSLAAITPLVLGAAMIGLGVMRVRDYRRLMAQTRAPQ